MKTQRITNPPEKLKKRLYNIMESAQYLGRPVWAVRELIWAGALPFSKPGRIYYLDVYDLDDFIEKNKTRITY